MRSPVSRLFLVGAALLGVLPGGFSQVGDAGSARLSGSPDARSASGASAATPQARRLAMSPRLRFDLDARRPATASVAAGSRSAAVVDDTLFYEGFADRTLAGWEVATTAPTDTALWTWSESDTFDVGAILLGVAKGLAGGHAYLSYDAYAAADSTAGPVEQSLVSPALTALAEADPERFYSLTFSLFLAYADTTEFAVSFSADGGATYGDPITLTDGVDADAPLRGVATVDVPAEVIGAADARLRFTYDGTFYAWAIDDVAVVGSDETDELFLEDFADGFDGFTSEGIEPDEAIWAYGTDTISGAFTREVMSSPSADNGFAVINIDGYFGTDAPDPSIFYEQVLTSPTYDLSALEGGNRYALQFFEELRFCCNTTVVDSVRQADNPLKIAFSYDDGATFTEPRLVSPRILVNDAFEGFNRILLPEGADTATRFRFRFIWDKAYYYAAVDDISVVVNPAVDLGLQENFYAVAPDYATPASQAFTSIRFLVDVLNSGHEAADFYVDAAVFRVDTATGGLGELLFLDSLLYEGVVYDSLAENQLFPERFFLSRLEYGRYVGVYSTRFLDSTVADGFPGDNVLAFEFEITENTFAKASPRRLSGIRSVDPTGDDNIGFEAGNVYYTPFADDLVVDSISFTFLTSGFTEESFGEVSFEAFVYGFNGDDEPGEDGFGVVQVSELPELSSTRFELDESYRNNNEPENANPRFRRTVVFDEPVDVSEFNAFGVSILYNQDVDVEGNFFMGVSTVDYSATTFARDIGESNVLPVALVNSFTNEAFTEDPETTVYSSLSPGFPYVITAYVSGGGPPLFTSVPEIITRHRFVARPNPTVADLYLDYDLGDVAADVSIEVVDALGRHVVRRDLDGVDAGTLQLSTRGWTSGIYFVRLRTDDHREAIRQVYVGR